MFSLIVLMHMVGKIDQTPYIQPHPIACSNRVKCPSEFLPIRERNGGGRK